MKEKFKQVASTVKTASDRVARKVTEAANHENTKAAAAWARGTATEAATQAAEHARELSKSQVARHAAAGAGFGALAAVPIPFVGPVFGAIVGGGIGTFVGLRRSAQAGTQAPHEPAAPFDFYEAMTDLDDLRQRGILTQEEFEARKRMLLRKP